MIYGKSFHLFTESDIISIVTDKIPENKFLEYKLKFNFLKDEDKKEFLYDVTSFANSEGGIIIYGISELKDDNGQNTGQPDEIIGIDEENYDKLINKIEQFLYSTIEPKISNLFIKIFKINNVNILLIGIPIQWGLPHMVIYQKVNKFYKRGNSGKSLLDVNELNQLFMKNSDLKLQAQQFRDKRISEIMNNQFIPNLYTKFSTIVHIIPLNYFQSNLLSLAEINKITQIRALLKPIEADGYEFKHNFEGYLLFNRDGSSVTAYSQLFRNGIVEGYTALLHKENSIDYFNHISLIQEKYHDFEVSHFETCVINFIKDVFEAFKLYYLNPPFLIYISIFHPINTCLDARLRIWKKFFTKNELLLPPTIINDFNAKIDVELKDVFDIIWQTGGILCSPNFNPNGERIKKQ
ncbi:MAG: hypothetical protein A2X08_16165 [Bacteroidetes bacterium GWA2_32_17]|nr:MAG: hypothetical protein A2X08_16165 [Bacteroidetes bacterium GWA2_32_17]